MSRLAAKPISLPEKVQAVIQGSELWLKGPKGEVRVPIQPGVQVEVSGGVLKVTLSNDSVRFHKRHQAKANLGLTWAMARNGVLGVSQGFTKVLELHGVGYRAQVQKNVLEMTLGFSHPVKYEIPAGIEVKVDKQTVIHVSGADKQLVGQVAADIRSFRPPEPYLGKGIRYQNEILRRKVGKSASK